MEKNNLTIKKIIKIINLIINLIKNKLKKIYKIKMYLGFIIRK